ncbi:MAG: hypothetical protein ACE5OZ_21080 [Candidatus Heimdallarchaeota archaeon]
MDFKKVDSRIPTGLLYLSPWGKIQLAKRPFFGELPHAKAPRLPASTTGLTPPRQHSGPYLHRRDFDPFQT